MIPGFSKNEAQECLDKCADDEPVFLLRGQDIMFADVVAAWCGMTIAEALGQNSEKANEKATRRLDELPRVRNWQDRNDIKLAD